MTWCVMWCVDGNVYNDRVLKGAGTPELASSAQSFNSLCDLEKSVIYLNISFPIRLNDVEAFFQS